MKESHEKSTLSDQKEFLVPKDPAFSRRYIIIDLKSFYASVECVERGMDPMATKLVVADVEREKGTICLAITPALKELGIKNRCRLYEIPDNVTYIIAPPRMQLYIDYSACIYSIYLKYLAKEDIHVYSIDEAFMDVEKYIKLYNKSAREIGIMIRDDILRTTGIPATCGVGTNLYLAKIALDITAKKSPDRIGELDEETYISQLWNHKPLSDFWRIGPQTEKKLARFGIYTMKDIATADEKFLYKMFGVDAELLIDHAWGREPTTMADIKSYTPKSKSLSTGQVLLRDYSFDEAKLVVKEMLDLLCYDLVKEERITDSISMAIGYSYTYGIAATGGTVKYNDASNSAIKLMPELVDLFKRTTYWNVPIRRINLCANKLYDETERQYDLFHSPESLDKEKLLQEAVVNIKERYGKNAILKGINLDHSGTTIMRNQQIGGHKSNG